MEWNLALGYAGALLTGLVLGLLGGGGALFSIPVLVYLFNIEASVATGYSLFLIGIAASSGAFQNIRHKAVDYYAALWYGIPSIVTVYIVRRFMMPNLPEVFFRIGAFTVDKNLFILLLLSLVMLLVAFKMISSSDEKPQLPASVKTSYFKLIIYAVLIGTFLGIVGAGGGFLMIPALIYFAKLPMKKAVGTSLVLVAINSFVGFLGDIHSDQPLDWKFLLEFSAFSVSGVLIGIYTHRFIDSNKLKKYFGWFMLAAAILIIIKETILK